MGTRSNIGVRNSDGSITAVYCHWDGYPSHNGRILLEHYNNLDTVKALMDLGDLSSLGPVMDPDKSKPHTLDEPQRYVCVAYGRDVGEKGVESQLFKSLEQYNRNMDNCGVDYQYLFDSGKWMFRSRNTDWKDLTFED